MHAPKDDKTSESDLLSVIRARHLREQVYSQAKKPEPRPKRHRHSRAGAAHQQHICKAQIGREYPGLS